MEGKKSVALDGKCQLVKRAITWEISDSEEDSDVKPESSTAFVYYSDVDSEGCSDKQKIEPCMALTETKAVPLLRPLTQIVSSNSKPERKKKKQLLEKSKMTQIKTEEKQKSLHKKEEKMKIKQQIAVKKQRRKEAASALKFLRPDQCMKQMIVCVDSGLLEHLGSDILLEVLDSLDCKYHIESQIIPHSITWKRKIFSRAPNSSLKVVLHLGLPLHHIRELAQLPINKLLLKRFEGKLSNVFHIEWISPLEVEDTSMCKVLLCGLYGLLLTLFLQDGCQEEPAVEREALLVMQPSYFLRQLSSLVQNACPDNQRSTPDLTHLCPFHNLEDPSTVSYSVVVIGLDTYQWYNQNNQLPQELITGLENATLQLGPEQSMTRHQIEEALVVLQLWGNVHVLFLETWQELAQHVSAVTRAIAQRPYKKHQEKQLFSFCVKGKWASGVHISKDGKGLRETWLKQIQQFNRVSPAVASAVAQGYPSPSLLLQAYQECNTDAERQLLLSNLQIRTKTERRIGPDLSRRIYLFMVSTNPELVLDLSC